MADTRFHPEAFYRGMRLVAMDGSNFDLPDEPDNDAHFGRPGSRTGVAGYPQARCAVLVECVTHDILGCKPGAVPHERVGDMQALAVQPAHPGMLCTG